MIFPHVNGNNLSRRNYQLPADFEGKLNLVIIPFERWQQSLVNTWIPFAQKMERLFHGFHYYELPTIYRMNILGRTFLNEGMRAGIPDQKARETTITLYLDKAGFRQSLHIPDEDDIYLFLVDQEGYIHWQSFGEFSIDKSESLMNALEGMLMPEPIIDN